MIEISLNTALLIYGILIALGLASSWVITEFAAARRYTALSEQDLWHCHFCTFTYLDRSGLRVSRCPRCQSYNLQPGQDPEPTAELALATVGDTDAHRRNASRRKRPGAKRRGPRRRR